jgi:hypothetical protein
LIVSTFLDVGGGGDVREKSREPKRGKSESRFLAVARGGTAIAVRCLPHNKNKNKCVLSRHVDVAYQNISKPPTHPRVGPTIGTLGALTGSGNPGSLMLLEDISMRTMFLYLF